MNTIIVAIRIVAILLIVLNFMVAKFSFESHEEESKFWWFFALQGFVIAWLMIGGIE